MTSVRPQAPYPMATGAPGPRGDQPGGDRPTIERVDEGGRHAPVRDRRTAGEVAFLRVILDNPDGVIILDPAGQALLVNDAAAGLLGHPARELVHSDLGLPVTGSGPTEVELFRRANGPGTAELRSAPIEWGGRPAILCTLRDTTEQARAERELAVLLTLLERITAAASMSEATAAILGGCCEVLRATVAQSWFVDAEGRWLEPGPFWAAQEEAGRQFHAASLGLRFDRDGVGPLRQVWRRGAPRFVADVAAEPDFRRLEAALAAGLRSGLFVPIGRGPATLGVLEFFGPAHGAPTDRELRFALAVADGLAAAGPPGGGGAKSGGKAPFREADPAGFAVACRGYGAALAAAMSSEGNGDDQPAPGSLLRDLALQLAAAGAGARDVGEIHAVVLDGLEDPDGPAPPGAAELASNLMLELMGELADAYRLGPFPGGGR